MLWRHLAGGNLSTLVAQWCLFLGLAVSKQTADPNNDKALIIPSRNEMTLAKGQF